MRPRTTSERSEHEEAHREDRQGGRGAPKSEAQKHFEAFEEVVTEALNAGEESKITGFG